MNERVAIEVVTRDDEGRPLEPPRLLVDDRLLWPLATANGWTWTPYLDRLDRLADDPV